MASDGASGHVNVDSVNFRKQEAVPGAHTDAASALHSNIGTQMRTEKLVNVGVDHNIALLDTAQRPITGSTTGIATLQTKTQLGVLNLISGQAPGEILLSKPLDTTIDELATQMAEKYVNWRMMDVSIVLENTAPFAAASGSIQVAYINDPENQLVDTDAEKILALVIRQAHSRQVKAKDTLEMRLNFDSLNVPGAPSQWKFCKSRPGRIFNMYGTVAAVVRSPPAKGDGASFPVSLAITWQFMGMTRQLATESEYIVVDDTKLTGYHANTAVNTSKPGFWSVKVNSTGFNPIRKERSLQILFDKPISYKATIKDTYNNEAEVWGLISQATVYNDGNNTWYYSFPVESNRFDGMVGELTRTLEFPNRTISAVVIQDVVKASINANQSTEVTIAKGIAQGISILTAKLSKLEFQVDQLAKDKEENKETIRASPFTKAQERAIQKLWSNPNATISAKQLDEIDDDA